MRSKADVSAATARTCRSVISGVLGLAARYGAISHNPVRDVGRIESRPKSAPRALTPAERVELLTHLNTDDKARRRDLPDLVFFMLATGVRIGEALGLIWSQVDLEAGTVHITSTLIRIKGGGTAAQGDEECGRGADTATAVERCGAVAPPIHDRGAAGPAGVS